MSFRRQKNKDSLDLLLDTMCNAFGGIILLAVLVALISGGRLQLAEPVDATDVSRLRDEAESELARLQGVTDRLQERIAAEGLAQKVELASQQQEVEAQVAALRGRLSSAQRELKELEESNPRERKASLAAELEWVDEQMQMAHNTLDGMNAGLTARRRALARVKTETSSVIEASVLRLRYPRERATSKLRYYVLVKHGRLYPTESPDGGQNHLTIDWTEVMGNSIARPRVGTGIDALKDSVQTGKLFAQLDPRSRYVAFVVFKDSFAAFTAAQRHCIRHGLEFGWEPTADSEVIFSTSGENPLPQ